MLTLVSIDTTPNPNSMKLNLDAPIGGSGDFSAKNAQDAPSAVTALLGIPGVVSVFVAASFVTLNRDARTDWPSILAQARACFAATPGPSATDARTPLTTDTPVKIWIQTFRGLPIQVKVSDGVQEVRVGLPERFGTAAHALQTHFGADYLKERHWADGGEAPAETLETVAATVAAALEESFPAEKLEALKTAAMAGLDTASTDLIVALPQAVSTNDLAISETENWESRFAAIQTLEATAENKQALLSALRDEKAPIRRWAAAKLAGLKEPEVVAALCERFLTDAHIGVRRTAGDSLSDIADVLAQPAACQALQDNNKLVRWRAARLLNEIGTTEALPALYAAQADVEYEVRLEIEAAIARIENNTEAALPIWKQIAEGTADKASSAVMPPD